MVVIGCLALGGLVIDLGMAILTQVQMQAVADPAALEGLRFRDALDGDGQPIGDEGRRAAAARIASLVFDDDLDSSAPPTMSLRIGAGPELVLTDHDDPTIAALHASRTITVPDQRTYLPQLQLNLTNEPYGDLVAGTFVSPWPTALSREDGNYGRNDFIPSEQVDSAGAPAFLVRLRRANDFEGLDHQEGVSSGGSPLPLLAGHGSLTPFANPDNPNNYNFRAHGFTVRATALADARPALQVGFPQTGVTPSIEGALPLALTLELWNGLPVGQPVVLAVDGTGTISGNGLALAGRFTPPPPDPNAAMTVGQAVVGKSTLAVNAAALARRYPDRVLLIDASLQLGVCALMLDVAPKTTIVDAVREKTRLDETMLRQLAGRHQSGLHVLAAPANAVDASEVDEESVYRVLNLARRAFPFVVVDTFPMLDSTVMAVLDVTDLGFIVMQGTAPSVVGMVKFLPMLKGLGFGEERQRLVLNHNYRNFSGNLKPADIEGRLDRELDYVFPYRKGVLIAANAGEPYIFHTHRYFGFGREMETLVDDIVAVRDKRDQTVDADARSETTDRRAAPLPEPMETSS